MRASLTWMSFLLVAACAVPSTRGGVGTQCDKNSDCAAPLVCRIGYCRIECRSSEDCLAPAACVLDENGRGACQLAAELSCDLATDCPAPLVCRFDHCTNECNADRDCAGGSTCRSAPDDPGGPRGCVYDVRASCALDGICPGDLVCGRDGQCRAECRTDRDCRNNRFCAVRGRCDERVTVCRDPDGDGIRSCLFACTPDCDAVPDDTRPYVCSPRGDLASLERACRPTCTAAEECGPRGWRCETHGGPTGECVPNIPDPLFADGGVSALDGSVPGVDGSLPGMDGAMPPDGSVGDGGVGDGGAAADGSFTLGCPVGATRFVEIAGTRANDYQHMCARASDGRVACWGANYYGALGRGTTGTFTSYPIEWVPSITDAVELAPGDSFTCVRRAGGTVSCWGAGRHGERGDGSYTMTDLLPDDVMGLTDATSVDSSWYTACATRAAASPVCWGQLFTGNSSTPMAETGAVLPAGGTQMSVGLQHRCTLLAGRIHCARYDGFLIISTDGPGSAITDFVALAAGGHFTCGLRAGGDVHCFGPNDYGENGTGAYATPDWVGATPVPLPGPAVAVEAGPYTTCAVLADGNVFCWGNNVNRLLARPATSPAYSITPLHIDGLPAAEALAMSTGTVCVITMRGEGLCWGGATVTPTCISLDPP